MPRLGGVGFAGGMPRYLVHHRAYPARVLPARRYRESETGAGLRHQCAADGDADLCFRRRACRACRCAGRTGLPGQSADGLEYHHRRVCGGGDWRHGVDHGRRSYRSCAGPRRGPDQGVLSRGFGHRSVHHHGDRAAAQARGPVRSRGLMIMEKTMNTAITIPAAADRQKRSKILYAILFAGLCVAPFVGYPIFLMTCLCFALFACAFNLLIGFTGLLSFGHAMFFGAASDVGGYAPNVWGLTPAVYTRWCTP